MIIGTAGHIDHGKTALIRALTGIETDRLKEEKKRGMSIDIGFACLDLSDGTMAGIVDVPGHSNFIRNMLAGAHGMDMVLLVIAADDGIMPQTIEHFEIVALLGIKKGVLVITKSDLVEKDRISELKDKIEVFVKGSCLEGSPVVDVSSVSGRGIALLKQVIEQSIKEISITKKDRPFRMPVDRSFSVKGFGTVVTGTVVSGTLAKNDLLKLFPGNKELRIRNMESFGKKKERVSAGERVALNLPGIEKEEIKRGDLQKEELGN